MLFRQRRQCLMRNIWTCVCLKPWPKPFIIKTSYILSCAVWFWRKAWNSGCCSMQRVHSYLQTRASIHILFLGIGINPWGLGLPSLRFMSCIMEKCNTVHSMQEWKSLFEMLTKFMWGLVQGDIAAWSSWLWEDFTMQSTRTKVVHPILSQVNCLFHCVSWNLFLHFLVLRRCGLWLFPHKYYFLHCYHTCQVCADPAGGSRCTLSLQQVVLRKWQAGALLTIFLFRNLRGMGTTSN